MFTRSKLIFSRKHGGCSSLLYMGVCVLIGCAALQILPSACNTTLYSELAVHLYIITCKLAAAASAKEDAAVTLPSKKGWHPHQ